MGYLDLFNENAVHTAEEQVYEFSAPAKQSLDGNSWVLRRRPGWEYETFICYLCTSL